MYAAQKRAQRFITFWSIMWILALAACSPGASAPTATPPALLPRVQQAGSCHSNGDLPDSKCTPGATNPAVTQATINQTICVSGYTKTIRPPVSYTDPLKTQQMSEYGFSDTKANHEEDHLIPLEVGGSPVDPKNLWPEPHAGKDGAVLGSGAKDQTENATKAAVCAGRMPLDTAQKRIASDWVSLYNEFRAQGLLPPPIPGGESGGD